MNKYWSTVNIAHIFLLSPAVKLPGCSHLATSVKNGSTDALEVVSSRMGMWLKASAYWYNTLGWSSSTTQKGRADFMSCVLFLTGGLLHT